MTTRPRLFAVAALSAMAAALWWLQRGSEPAPPHGEAAAAAPVEVHGDDAPTAELGRRELPMPAPPDAASPTSSSAPAAARAVPTEVVPPQLVEPWVARFLVVDAKGAPVADATVTIAAPRPLARGQAWPPSASDQVLALRHTDVLGQAEAALAAEYVVVQASKADQGNSGEVTVWHFQTSSATTLRLAIPVTLRGRVLHGDGRPACGAEVLALARGNTEPDAVAASGPATTGEDGRFELRLHRLASYEVEARLGALRAAREIQPAAVPAELTLTFRGDLTIGGSVVDAEGKPAAYTVVSVWRDGLAGTAGAAAPEPTTCSTDDGGRFSTAVREHARYVLIAGGRGSARSRPVWVETTAAQPHAEVRLHLLPMATIRGHVRRGDGSAFEGVQVSAEPEMSEGDAGTGPSAEDRFPPVAEVSSGPDGAFELRVHPDATWVLSARPRTASALDLHGGTYVDTGSEPRRRNSVEVRQPGVRSGQEGVVLLISDAELAGCVVHGTVVRSDGQPLGRYMVDIFEYEAGVRRRWVADANMHGDTFTTMVLPLGKQYELCVRTLVSEPLVRFGPEAGVAGPFWTDRAHLHVEVRLEPLGEVPVRVFDASGAPASNVRVRIQGASVLGDRGPGRLVAEGRALLRGVAPGRNTLLVHRGTGLLWEQEILVVAGPNSEVTVRLPAAK